MNTNRFRSRGTLVAALMAVLTAGFKKDGAEWNSTVKRGFGSGKHNGRCAGAFGGPGRAKAHRACYLAQGNTKGGLFVTNNA